MSIVSLQDRHALIRDQIAATRTLVEALGTDDHMEARNALCQRYFGHWVTDNIDEQSAVAIRARNEEHYAEYAEKAMTNGVKTILSRGLYVQFLYALGARGDAEAQGHFRLANRHFNGMVEALLIGLQESQLPEDRVKAHKTAIQAAFDKLQTNPVLPQEGTPEYQAFITPMVTDFVEDSLKTAEISLGNMEQQVAYDTLCQAHADVLPPEDNMTPSLSTRLTQGHCEHKAAHAESFLEQAHTMMSFFWKGESPVLGATPRQDMI